MTARAGMGSAVTVPAARSGKRCSTTPFVKLQQTQSSRHRAPEVT